MIDVLFGAALTAALEAWVPTALQAERHQHLVALSALLSGYIVMFGAPPSPARLPPRWEQRTPGLSTALENAASLRAETDACWRLLSEAGAVLPYDDRMDVFEQMLREHRDRGLRASPSLPTLAAALRIPRRDYQAGLAATFFRVAKC